MYNQVMIRSFADKRTAALFQGHAVKRMQKSLQQRAHEKLLMLDAATDLSDLRVPPGNRLEPLKSDRRGQYSVRVNDQWRVCFVWRGGNAHDVEVVDYHRG